MKRRPSMLLILVGLGVVVSGAAVLIGVHLATGRVLVAVIVALAVWVGAGVLGLGIARVNDRLGHGLHLQRRSTAAVLAALDSRSSDHKVIPAPMPTARPVPEELGTIPAASVSRKPPSPPTPPTDARDRLRDLLQLPKTTLGIQSHGDGPRGRPVNGSSTPVNGAVRPASAVRVAMVADEFTYRSFEPEWTTTRLHPSNWRKVMEETQPEVFFCESAWAGGTPPERPWQGQIYDSVRRVHEGRSALIDIIAYCRKKGIPTVFWNKEDPIHFGDRIHDFVVTANLFDAVFTTAAECVEGYGRDADVEHVGVLPFAVQPRIFNPFGATERTNSAVFAGSWYPNYSDRAEAAKRILDLVLASGRSLEIFDRMYDSPERHRFPENYDRFRRAAIPYEETAEAYRKHKFSITLNTITSSQTMFARRIYEAAACGSVILSNTSVGVETVFGDSVILADRDPHRLLELTEDEYTRMQAKSIEIAMQNTYAHRAHTVLEMAGVTHAQVNGSSSLAIQVSTAEDACAAGRAARELGFDDAVCVINGGSTSLTELQDSISGEDNIRVLERAASGQIGIESARMAGDSVFYGKLGDLPSKEWLANARSLLPYAPTPLTRNLGGTSYSRASAEGTLDTLMTRKDFENYVCGNQPLAWVHSV